jgi:hypothetical protein
MQRLMRMHYAMPQGEAKFDWKDRSFAHDEAAMTLGV